MIWKRRSELQIVSHANLGDAPTRHLIICTPAGFERYFERMAAERRGEEPPEWAL